VQHRKKRNGRGRKVNSERWREEREKEKGGLGTRRRSRARKEESCGEPTGRRTKE